MLGLLAPSQHVVFLGGPGVRYKERLAPAALAPWVAVHWRIETDVDFDLRIPPDGCMDLIGGDVAPGFRSLERLAVDAPAPDPVVLAVLNASDVRMAARESGYSERQLRRRGARGAAASLGGRAPSGVVN